MKDGGLALLSISSSSQLSFVDGGPTPTPRTVGRLRGRAPQEWNGV